MLSIHKLNLSHFRNYGTLRLAPDGARVVVLTGPNGSGKTNILEAVSLLAPGRGLRGAELAELQERGEAESLWAVSAEIETKDGQRQRAGTGLAREGDRRVMRVDGKDARGGHVLAAVWLTPQMDRLFIEGASARRRFLDRLVYAFDPEHAGRVARAEKNTRERMKLLQDGRSDEAWFTSLESQMAADFVAIGAGRLDLVTRLRAHIAKGDAFPEPLVAVAGEVEARLLKGGPALDIEDAIRAELKQNRAPDAAAGRTGLGTHRSDFAALHAAKGMEAALCSTGEQKGLLVSIVLAHALMMKAEKGFVPVLLLDEVVAHLDAARREILFARLAGMGGQAWLTGTDAVLFQSLKGLAKFFEVESAAVREAA